jgi:aryl-alcohol dehydrogenase-like predicted oxidoreductase
VSKFGYASADAVGKSLAAKLPGNAAHCISPSFARDQVETSLKRMDVETLDYVLLNNPERMLMGNPAVSFFLAGPEKPPGLADASNHVVESQRG